MNSLEQFQLESDVPGVVTSFTIPADVVVSKLQKGETLDINYRHLYKRMTGRKRSSAISNSSILAPKPQSSSAASSRAGFKSSNIFENIIDKLEKKYYTLPSVHRTDHSQAFTSDGESTNSTHPPSPEESMDSPDHHSPATSSSSSSKKKKPPIAGTDLTNPDQQSTDALIASSQPMVEPIAASSATTTATNNNKKRSKKLISDTYDYNDPFLDDSEAIEEYESIIVSQHHHSNKQQHQQQHPNKRHKAMSAGGFYVQDAAAAIGDDDEDVMDEDEEEDGEENLSPQASAASTATTTLAATSGSSGRAAVNTSGNNSDKNSKSKKQITQATKVVTKPATTSTKQNNKQAKALAANSQVTTAAAAISTSSTGEANQLAQEEEDDVDPTHAFTAPSATAAASAGGKSTIKKEKAAIIKPTWQPSPAAQIALDTFKASIAEFIPQQIQPLKRQDPYPKALEAALLTLDRTVHQSHSSKELTSTTVGYLEFIQSCLSPTSTAPSATANVFPTGRIKTVISRLYSQEIVQAKAKQIEKMIQTFIQAVTSSIVKCPDYRQPGYNKAKKSGSAAAGAAGEGGGELFDVSLLEEGTTNEEQPATSTQQAALSPTVPATITYEWYIQWNNTLRQQLLDLHDQIRTWVSLENDYRHRLTNVDKKGLLEKDVVTLHSEVEIEKVLVRIAAVFPASCLNGDLAGIKKAAKTELAHLAKLEQLKKAQMAVATAALAAAKAGNTSQPAATVAAAPARVSGATAGVVPRATVAANGSKVQQTNTAGNHRPSVSSSSSSSAAALPPPGSTTTIHKPLLPPPSASKTSNSTAHPIVSNMPFKSNKPQLISGTSSKPLVIPQPQSQQQQQQAPVPLSMPPLITIDAMLASQSQD